jgi:hypothetical protein
MSRSVQFALVLGTVLLIASGASHFLIQWFGIEDKPMAHKVLAGSADHPMAFVAGSSLMQDGLSWNEISEALGCRTETWFVPGSSPSEWEMAQKRGGEAKLNIVVISAYDLNEYTLCDFHSEVVPLAVTTSDLWHSHSSWHFTKRVLSQYPLKYLRLAFPLIGRSQGVMVGLRAQSRRLLKPWIKLDAEATPTVSATHNSSDEDAKTEKISQWSPAKMLRRLAALRNASQGKQGFDGAKRLALIRMLQQSERQGRVIVVVLPVSPTYSSEVLRADAARQFEDEVTNVRQKFPQAEWVRLDQESDLLSDDNFWDLVHMNSYGQHVATEKFLATCSRRPVTSLAAPASGQ